MEREKRLERIGEREGLTRTVQLSKRLQALADMVTPGNVVADVGCDHGFLSIYLLERGIAPRVIAGDVRKGPLSAARAHVEERGLSAYIETRLSDGLQEYLPGEAQTLVCAGMGGKLMQRILLQHPDVTGAFQEMILQPQSEHRQFRVFLREQGFVVTDENILCEDGKYYFMFRAVPGGCRADTVECGNPDKGGNPGAYGGESLTADAFGEKCGPAADLIRLGEKYGAKLLEDRHPVLRAYLERCLAACLAVQEQLLSHRGEAGSRERLEQSLAENEAEIADLRSALSLYEV